MVVKKRGLGRGLDALIGAASFGQAATDAQPGGRQEELRSLPVDLVQRGRYQPRRDFNPEALEELANSIRTQGLMQPIVVRPVGGERYEIIAGERRWRAAQMAGLGEIAVIVRDVPDEAAIAMALIENIQREDLNAIEEAVALQRLQQEFGLTHEQIAEAVGKSRSHVANTLRLLNLPPRVRDMLRGGALSAGTVWGVATPTTAFYRILPGKSADEGRQVLGDFRGTVVVDGYAVYEVLARDGPGFALAHCWAHTKRKFQANATDWPTACGEIDALIGDLYDVDRLVPGRFPGDAAAQALRHQLRQERSRGIADRIKTWATEQVGLPRSELGKAVRYMLERWTGLTRFLDNPCIPLDNNAAYAARGISRSMPPPRLCRTSERTSRAVTDLGRVTRSDAA